MNVNDGDDEDHEYQDIMHMGHISTSCRSTMLGAPNLHIYTHMHLLNFIITSFTTPTNLGYYVPSPLLFPYIFVMHFMIVNQFKNLSTACIMIIIMDQP